LCASGNSVHQISASSVKPAVNIHETFVALLLSEERFARVYARELHIRVEENSV